jgi:hypothetical protein
VNNIRSTQCTCENENCLRSFGLKIEIEELLGRAMCTWTDIIKTDFIQIILEDLDWVCLAQDTGP